MTSFIQMIESRWRASTTISVGLDPEPARLPEDLRHEDPCTAIWELNRRVILATADLAAAYKPNIAFYEALGEGGITALRRTVETVRKHAPGVPVLLDAKRADIGSTNEKYATAIFDDLDADAVTVHPYLGPEAMAPILDRADKGVFVLCRTSNPGAGRYQDLLVDGAPLYQHIAHDVATEWNRHGNCGLVVGATYPEEMRAVRAAVGDLPILVPGIGAQGGDVVATVTSGTDSRGWGLLLNAGRSLMYAFEDRGGSVESATAAAIEELHEEILSIEP
jgi:orotidine-5'-phosphate decarboxylase